MDSNLKDVIDLVIEISGDSTTPRNVKERLTLVVNMLNQDEDVSIKVNKALHELDEIVNENSMQQYTRTQIWNVVSLLEKV